MPCVAHRTNKTHHSPLNLFVLVIIHVYVAFRADLAAISLNTSNHGQIGSECHINMNNDKNKQIQR